MVISLTELAKSWLVVTEEAVDTAREVFNGCNIHITADGHCYLGDIIGSNAFEHNKRYKNGFLISRGVKDYC